MSKLMLIGTNYWYPSKFGCTIFRKVRFQSTLKCTSTARTQPIDPSAKTIRHLQFVKEIPFETGIDIQEKFVRAHLDIKQLQSKIKREMTNLQKEHNAEIQLNFHEQMILDNINQMKPNPIVLTFQFEPTYTGGKRVKKQITDEQIARYEGFIPSKQKYNKKPKFVQAERGGQVTFHGPGQIVAYIILDLKTFQNLPAKCLVSTIDNAAMNALKVVPKFQGSDEPLNLITQKTNDTGVWVSNQEKIASIGIHVRRSVTSHGICINVDPDLSYMNSFTMCGLSEKKATSIREQVPDSSTSVNDVAVAFVNQLAKLLGITTVERIQLDDLPIYTD
ncbi:lipoyl(octanoyl) transferase LIP2 [Kluyveromyces lactis]|uniref:Octanoyltransferase, mitochondrial n=1 Tax=Kluyveromyces lactis (strain ATCC 8585 / CBS 2359 / DSM 70799 / NBRC 1267 / NRRL Y-1140 / WM37) TaxID=284590 RepID=LIPB_KLULA|nr:uncharacterized protein KLLA0_D18777g [Kluyveromyces lactis]O13476.1 RecName: Full=Octanoyltransferase, mitochondrial; AltName: Full=Lipoate biosynthesis protein; AltName: Full=Lipoate-protein ligase; AltName: Full=Lipoyl ligase; AltName: Full=Lipoyl/octanoyl transferase; AltName: Full=Octanoyl-[acyl-carrier-protein]-protein N-octanoyltransferase; Flags: Precursor [Kluyveromyces lactis NRRL Y-1140]CAA60954.1 KlLIPB [Kluyveromyces lactis]CAH00989.1 KLLA0D18777p [Kluyveromyces lactis]|eukprot:XP_453893.1 uncharacterized protein KLLA0_D18777g [Kluyveromyces lactis]